MRTSQLLQAGDWVLIQGQMGIQHVLVNPQLTACGTLVIASVDQKVQRGSLPACHACGWASHG